MMPLWATRNQPLQSQWITGDQNIINMRVVVQYSVSVPSDYLFQSQDVARAVVFLASDAAEFITGQTIWVDGGLFSKPSWPYP